MENSITQVLMQGGISSIIVVAWFFFNKSNMKAFEAILAAQSAREEQTTELLIRTIDSQDKRAEALQQTLSSLIAELSDVKHLVVRCPRAGVKNEE